LTLAAVRMLVQLASQRADEVPAVSGAEPLADRFGDDPVAEQGGGFG
jgi:hypothetical protein